MRSFCFSHERTRGLLAISGLAVMLSSIEVAGAHESRCVRGDFNGDGVFTLADSIQGFPVAQGRAPHLTGTADRHAIVGQLFVVYGANIVAGAGNHQITVSDTDDVPSNEQESWPIEDFEIDDGSFSFTFPPIDAVGGREVKVIVTTDVFDASTGRDMSLRSNPVFITAYDADPNATAVADEFEGTVSGHFGPPRQWSEDWNNDGIPDHFFYDNDGDGNPERADVDTNNDGHIDKVYRDRNDDGTWDFEITDTDHDGWFDGGKLDPDLNGHYDYRWTDRNGNGRVDPGEVDPIRPEQPAPRHPRPRTLGPGVWICAPDTAIDINGDGINETCIEDPEFPSGAHIEDRNGDGVADHIVIGAASGATFVDYGDMDNDGDREVVVEAADSFPGPGEDLDDDGDPDVWYLGDVVPPGIEMGPFSVTNPHDQAFEHMRIIFNGTGGVLNGVEVIDGADHGVVSTTARFNYVDVGFAEPIGPGESVSVVVSGEQPGAALDHASWHSAEDFADGLGDPWNDHAGSLFDGTLFTTEADREGVLSAMNAVPFDDNIYFMEDTVGAEFFEVVVVEHVAAVVDEVAAQQVAAVRRDAKRNHECRLRVSAHTACINLITGQSVRNNWPKDWKRCVPGRGYCFEVRSVVATKELFDLANCEGPILVTLPITRPACP